jgi:hypothetical protein
MSIPNPPKPAKLVVGMFTAERALAAEVAAILMDRFGPLDMVSPWLAFDFTSYYESEMGKDLHRRLFVFKRLIQQDQLAAIKLFTNRIEQRYVQGEDHRRRVNIDPGYLLFERFVLATGKNFTHRIYLDEGIYADLTLIYQKGGFRKLPWTYPDYADGKMLSFLTKVREKYNRDMQVTKGTELSKEAQP